MEIYINAGGDVGGENSHYTNCVVKMFVGHEDIIINTTLDTLCTREGLKFNISNI